MVRWGSTGIVVSKSGHRRKQGPQNMTPAEGRYNPQDPGILKIYSIQMNIKRNIYIYIYSLKHIYHGIYTVSVTYKKWRLLRWKISTQRTSP